MTGGVTRIEGRAIPFGRANVDTDLIIPATYLKTLSRCGLGAHAFEPIRREPGNSFDDPANRGANILIAGENFGCGSSREHAVWAITDLGIQAIIAPSFSDIFAGNAFRNGLVTVALDHAAVDRLLDIAREVPFVIDLEPMEVIAGGESFGFALDPFRRYCLMNGLDEIGLTLSSKAAIAAYEARSSLLAFAIAHPSSSAAAG